MESTDELAMFRAALEVADLQPKAIGKPIALKCRPGNAQVFLAVHTQVVPENRLKSASIESPRFRRR